MEYICQRHGAIKHYLKKDGCKPVCSKCASGRVVRSRRRSKALLMDMFGGKCVLCGFSSFPGALHFHHVDPATKSFALSHKDHNTRAFADLALEAFKCVLLCGNCHSELHEGLHEGVDLLAILDRCVESAWEGILAEISRRGSKRSEAELRVLDRGVKYPAKSGCFQQLSPTRILECKNHGMTQFSVHSNGRKRCKKCMLEVGIRNRRKRAAKLMDACGGCCNICGYDRCTSALHLHHVGRGGKVAALSRLVSKPISVQASEAQKCLLVCSNCHSSIHGGLISSEVLNILYLGQLECTKERLSNWVRRCGRNSE